MNAPLVAHLIYHFGVGGMENGLVNLINNMPESRYRHAILCITGYSDFRRRLQREVEVVALDKRPGHDPGWHLRLLRELRRLRPAVLHTRNLAALEGQVAGALAGVPGRVHGEHGRDVFDLEGRNFRYNLLRRAVRPLVHGYIPVSRDLEQWLRDTVKVPAERVTQIYNGVDSVRFHPRQGPRAPIGPQGFCDAGHWLVGTVGRMAEVKDQLTLARAFVELLHMEPDARARVRLLMVGEGPLREPCLQVLRQADAEHLAWLPGERSDVPELMRAMDLFVLPSRGEGISNTILEAMSSGLPVVATRVGGNPELVDQQRTGLLVPAADPSAMAHAMRLYYVNAGTAADHARAGRAKVEARFSMDAMVQGYMGVYDRVLQARGRALATAQG